MPTVDVAIPCYNYGRYLPDCVESVLGQGIAGLRVLIIDNASTDGSVEVARRLTARDGRISLLARAENLGPHASFNAAVDWARGDYFMILCADDMLAPGALARAVAVMQRNPGVVVAYGTERHLHPGQSLPSLGAEPEDWTIRTGAEFLEMRCRNPEHYIAHGTMLVRTAAQRRAGHYREALRHADDFEMLLRLATLGGVASTGATQGIKRLHPACQTQEYLGRATTDLPELLAALDSFFRHEGAALPGADRLHRLARHALAQRAYWSAVKRLARADRAAAAELFRFAVRMSPRTAVLPPLGYLLRMDRRPADIWSGLTGHARPG